MTELEIVGVNSEGSGLARHGEGAFVVFVPGALPGERVRCRIVRATKTYAVGKVLDILSAASARVVPQCPVYGRCGGCQLQHAAYPEQLEIKRTILGDAFRRIARMELAEKVACRPSPRVWAYRNKTALPIAQGAAAHGGKEATNPLVCGYYERGSHRVVPFRACPVLERPLEELVPALLRELRSTGFSGYDEKKHTGDLRHLIVRAGDASSGGTLTGVVGARELSSREYGRLRDAHQRFAAAHPGVRGSVFNLKTDRGNFIWGPVFRTLSGARTILQRLGTFDFEIDVSAFFQVNREQTEALFAHVGALLADGAARSLLELYSGVGGLTAFLASCAEHVDAVEEWRPAARLLEANMERNGIENVRVHVEAAEEFASDPLRAAAGAYDTVVLDPPRTGCDPRVLVGIGRIAPRRIVYVSCNPATLARDVARLAEGGYALGNLDAFDMFPQTAHVESVALLRRD